MPRYAIGVEYDGSEFRGWQRLTQADAVDDRTVQGVLEAALSSVADAPVKTVCAGRTDAGVHAQCQVAHFDSGAMRDPRAWTLGTTTRLPPSVSLVWCRPVADGFNARFSAVARRYRYRVLNRPVRPALARQWLSWHWRPLDADAMHRAAQALLGEHDFGAFRSAECEATHARRDLQRITVAREGEVVVIDVQANAFLHHMVRNIVGSLLEVGAGARPEAWIADLLATRDRTRAGPTAPAAGLVFVGPLYPPIWSLPANVQECTEAPVG
ncbi:tRNA pseudouridine(38-40) synthase TruA [Luteimonas saliphila]|uniref:tRNA pseudouridine(38-40) synthase TruA n=1 Tax=Luteimonas saliphila TaxID=2804919 RepID=UPI00192D2C49